MPDLPEPIQNLISRMLTVDPSLRISIQEIKEHPAFRMFTPEGYEFPKPFPVPFIAEPMDPKTVPPVTFSVLRCIGYQSDQEVIDELTAPHHTMAKVFAHMLSHDIAIDALNWPTDVESEAMPSEMFMISPDQQAIGSLHMNDPFRRRKAVADVSSPETFSLVERRFATAFPEEQEPQLEDQAQTFDKIYVPLDALMCGLQKCLTTEAGFEYLHPDDQHMFARNTADNSYVIIIASYTDEEEIQLSLIPLRIEKPQFDALVDVITICIQGLIDTYSNPTPEDSADN